jgi:hypothetical protein
MEGWVGDNYLQPSSTIKDHVLGLLFNSDKPKMNSTASVCESTGVWGLSGILGARVSCVRQKAEDHFLILLFFWLRKYICENLPESSSEGMREGVWS